MTKDLTDKVNAGQLVGAMAEKVGGKGGHPDMAMAGGSEPQHLLQALSLLKNGLQQNFKIITRRAELAFKTLLYLSIYRVFTFWKTIMLILTRKIGEVLLCRR